MVKAEVKAAVEKSPIGEGVSYQVKIVDGEKAAENTEEVAVKFQDERPRRSPRAGVFICLLVLVLLVGFLVVYVVQKSKRDEKRGLNFGDDGIVVTKPPDLSNASSAWRHNVSWETQEEFYTLSDVITQDDILGLRPIFRKDLPRDYIAYWEAKIKGKSGEKYVIISAARQTGDKRLAEEGSLPSPSDVLSDQARRNGHGCHRVYRLRPDGLMACEDTSTNKFVAVTGTIDSYYGTDVKRPRMSLNKQIKLELPRLKKEWDKQAERVLKDPEWVRFQWLSMETDESATSTSPTKALPLQTPTSLETDFNFQVEETDDGFKAELGLRPGDSVRIPMGEGFREVRIKFVGLRDGDLKKTKGFKKRWQKRLCRVLCDVCEGEAYLDMTMVNKRFFKLTRMGDRFIKVQVDVDESFVRKHLEGQEIRFKIELRTRGSKVMVLNYGIVLRSGRSRRSFLEQYFAVPHEELFPRYRQHKHGQCLTGSGPVAWAKILGYYDNMAAVQSNSSYPSVTRLTGLSTPLPVTMDSSVKNLTQRIFRKLGSHCSPHGGGVTSPAQMAHIRKALKNVLGQEIKVVHRGGRVKDPSFLAELIKDLLKKGYPVVISQAPQNQGEHHYTVATRIRQSAKYYSFCNRKTDACSPWTLREESLIFVHEEDKPGKWENADINFVAAVIPK